MSRRCLLQQRRQCHHTLGLATTSHTTRPSRCVFKLREQQHGDVHEPTNRKVIQPVVKELSPPLVSRLSISLFLTLSLLLTLAGQHKATFKPDRFLSSTCQQQQLVSNCNWMVITPPRVLQHAGAVYCIPSPHSTSSQYHHSHHQD